MMAIVMMAMLIVLVMMIIVPEALRQVNSVHQHSCQTIHKLTYFHWPKALCGTLNIF
jgi:competence protein ComGC